MKFYDYVTSAFKNQFNLLLLGGGVALAFLSLILGGEFFGILALVAAAEVAYLSIIPSNPRYQRIINAAQNAIKEKEAKRISDETFQRVFGGLEGDDKIRFSRLASKCKSIQENLSGVNTESVTGDQVSDVDKLLWKFVRLLIARKTVAKFMRSIDEGTLTRELESVKARLSKIVGLDPLSIQKRATLDDLVQTATKRLENYHNIKGNVEMFELKLEQVESKLNALSEMAIGRHDPTDISSGIERIANDVEIGEHTVAELRDMTGMDMGGIKGFEDAPAIMSKYVPDVAEEETPKPRVGGVVRIRSRS